MTTVHLDIFFEGKTYRVEHSSDEGFRVGVVVINHVQAQHPYTRWLPRDGKRTKLILSEPIRELVRVAAGFARFKEKMT